MNEELQRIMYGEDERELKLRLARIDTKTAIVAGHPPRFSALTLSVYQGEPKYVVVGNYTYLATMERLDTERLLPVAVGHGFCTDLASLPPQVRTVWSLLHLLMHNEEEVSCLDRAAIIHDFLYYKGQVCGELVTRKQADKIFADAMRHAGVPMFVRKVAYYGVRLFGGPAWDEHRRNSR